MTSQEDFAGIVAAQNEIIAHWKTARNGENLPGRSNIDPGVLRAHLGSISILEIDPEGTARFRLIGTRLRDILGSDMRGLCLEEASETAMEIWQTGLQHALESRRPVFGIEERGKAHHGWLRLPLAPLADGGALVLCHDVLLRRKSRERSLFPGRLPLILQSATA